MQSPRAGPNWDNFNIISLAPDVINIMVWAHLGAQKHASLGLGVGGSAEWEVVRVVREVVHGNSR